MGRRQLFYQALVEPPQTPSAGPTTPTILGWLQQLSVPDPMVRRFSAALIASGLIQAPIVPPTTTTPTPSAEAAWGQPIKRKQLFYQQQTQVFPLPPVTPTPTATGWLQPLSQPEQRFGLPVGMEGFHSGNSPPNPPIFMSSWYRQLDEPTKPRTTRYDEIVRSFTQPAPPVAPSFAWLAALSEPVRGPKARESYVTPVLAETNPAGLPPFGWYRDLESPVKGPKVYAGFITPVLARSNPPVISPESWYQPLSQPVRGPKVYHTTPDMPLPVLGPVSAPPPTNTPPPPTWTPHPEEGGTWTHVSPAGGTWDKVNENNGSWSKVNNTTDTWTKKMPSGASWTKK